LNTTPIIQEVIFLRIARNLRTIGALLIVFFLATMSSAGLQDRLEPIVISGDAYISVDTFIIGTEDKYIATIVRNVPEAFSDEDFTMNETLLQYDKDDLSLVEKMVFDKNTKRIALLERSLFLAKELIAPVVVEPGINSDYKRVQPGSVEELMWDGVAGPDGWGVKLLSDDPNPVALSGDRCPIDTKRYVPVAKKAIGGIFLDKESVTGIEGGCKALFVESFDPDAEMYYGGMVMQYAEQPYVGALYAVTGTEFSFSRKAARQMRYTIYGLDNKVIYSVKIASPMWDDGSVNPMNLDIIEVLASNMPEDLYSVMSADVEAHRSFARDKIEELKKMIIDQEDQNPDL
jgi:hypothetical protein